LLSAIGDGAMGSVYRAGRIGLDREVAVKFIDSRIARDASFRRRFEVELRAMGRLKHPNCVSVIDYGVEALPYLVMEMVEGQSLRSLLGGGPLPAPRALAITSQLLAGLAHAHAKGIVHRDIKPENILLENVIGVPGDCVRIVDFGLAKLLDGASSLTLGSLLGSPHYMPPEQMRPGDIDERVDIYSTGIVMFEMLTGRKPFDGPNIGDVLLAQKQQPPPSLASAAPGLTASPALERVIQRALEKYPGARFRSALDMQRAIAALPDVGRSNGVAPAGGDVRTSRAGPPSPHPGDADASLVPRGKSGWPRLAAGQAGQAGIVRALRWAARLLRDQARAVARAVRKRLNA
jgi:eukaryotic-like serine/threonine-protein kinase